MNILFIMIPLSLALVVLAGWLFFWAVGSGQFDDLESPSWDVVQDGAGETSIQRVPVQSAGSGS